MLASQAKISSKDYVSKCQMICHEGLIMPSNSTSKMQILSHFLCVKTTEAGKGPLLPLKYFNSTNSNWGTYFAGRCLTFSRHC